MRVPFNDQAVTTIAKTCMLFAFNLQPDDYLRTLKLMRVFILLNLRMRLIRDALSLCA